VVVGELARRGLADLGGNRLTQIAVWDDPRPDT
jgi:hypothetical protein